MTSVRVCSFFKTGPLWDFTTFAFAIHPPLLPPPAPHPLFLPLRGSPGEAGAPSGMEEHPNPQPPVLHLGPVRRKELREETAVERTRFRHHPCVRRDASSCDEA